MAKALLLITIFAGSLSTLVKAIPEPPQQFLTGAYGNLQDDRALTIDIIEELLKKGYEDKIIAREIRTRGIGFRIDSATWDRLINMGAGPLIQQELLLQEEHAAYTDFLNEKNRAKRQKLGREFLQKYSSSSEAPKVTAVLREVDIDVFDESLRAFLDNPTAPGLDRVLTLGRELLDRWSDRATVVHVGSRLALATGRGIINNFYSDLDQSRAYSNQTLKLLEDPVPPPDMDSQSFNRLRAQNLGIIYQCLGLYQLAQPDPDQERAIDFLNKAAELKDSPSANDPITYLLRARSRQENFQKLSDEYSALPKDQRVGRRGQFLCVKITDLVSELNSDYLQAVFFSGRANSPQLADEAMAAIKMLATSERPCLGGRSGLIDEWPSEEHRSALVIGVEDYLDKHVGNFNYAASDASDIASALKRYGGFRKEQVVLLATGESRDRQPFRSVILQQLDELRNRVKQDDLLLIYFVGHTFENAGKTYLLASDSYTNNERLLSDTAINVEQLKEGIRSSGAGQVMLIFDSFRQAPVGESFSSQLSFDVRKNEATAFATLLSASAGQRAYESQVKKQGHFTSVFLEAVKGKAVNRNRVVTLESLINYLRTTVPQEAQHELGANAQQAPSAIVAGYDAENLVMFLPDSGGQQSLQPANQDLAELLRASKTIYIKPKTVWMNSAVLGAELSKLPEFQGLNLKIVNDAKEADLVIEVRLPALTWMWNYTVIHRSSNVVLTSGKLRGLTDETVSPKLAKDMVSNLQKLRDSPRK